ncbi:MAG: LVIVD repeat-containing protein [Vicinamibacterales bacterium]
MRVERWLCVGAVLLSVAIHGRAQEQADRPDGPARSQGEASAPAPATVTDPRVGLKGGLRDAGRAARNLELVVSLPKPAGFFDPKAPAGEPTPPEREPRTPGADPDDEPDDEPDGQQSAGQRGGAPNRPERSGLSFANSDLAFNGEHLFMGNFHGFNTYDIEDPKRARLIASVVCPGGQGDVSVHGHLLIMSVEQTRGRIDCGTEGVKTPVSAERFRGIRIFDISDVRKPTQVAAVQTCRGSHTHTLVTDPNDKENLYVYGSGTGSVRSSEELAGCSGKDPKEDPNTALFSIDVIQVPLAAPETARIVNRPRIFADSATGAISGLWPGGNHGPGTQRSRRTNQCHDITVFPEVGLAAGACSGNGILLDISDPVHPVRLDAVVDKNFAYWHSATFNNDGSKVIFTDEWGGGTRPRCRATDPPTWGADAIFDIVDRKLRFGGYYKLPAAQTEQENCVAHNGSIIPVPGRDIMVQAWYQGGVSVFDFTDASKPLEIAFFDRGPIDPKQLITGGYWSTYWYNGHIYGAEIARGLDVFKLKPSEYLSQNEIDAATQVRSGEFNAQKQPRIAWPATSVVARAYVDQLTRSKSLQPDRASAVKAALARADRVRSARDQGAAAAADQLDALAAQLEADAGGASARDAGRLRSLASTLKGRTAGLR